MLCLLLRDREPQRYGRAAVRWLARFGAEEPDVLLDEVVLVATHLAALRGQEQLPTMRSLAELLDAHGRRELAKALRSYAVEAAGARSRA